MSLFGLANVAVDTSPRFGLTICDTSVRYILGSPSDVATKSCALVGVLFCVPNGDSHVVTSVASPLDGGDGDTNLSPFPGFLSIQ